MPRPRKITESDLENSFKKLFGGTSLRAIARSLRVDHKSLRARLLLKDESVYRRAIKKGGVSVVFNDYLKSTNSSRLRKEAENWLSKHSNDLIDIEMSFPDNTVQIRSNRQISLNQISYFQPLEKYV